LILPDELGGAEGAAAPGAVEVGFAVARTGRRDRITPIVNITKLCKMTGIRAQRSEWGCFVEDFA